MRETDIAEAPAHTGAIVGLTLTRVQVEALIADTDTPLLFEGCDFEGADLSRLNLRGCCFTHCNLAEASLYAALLSHSQWQQCRGRQADFAMRT